MVHSGGSHRLLLAPLLGVGPDQHEECAGEGDQCLTCSRGLSRPGFHTLATQAINRGVSLEAIDALLGRADLSMTMVYARIGDRTVADQ